MQMKKTEADYALLFPSQRMLQPCGPLPPGEDD
jgi:hypothetical protein